MCLPLDPPLYIALFSQQANFCPTLPLLLCLPCQ